MPLNHQHNERKRKVLTIIDPWTTSILMPAEGREKRSRKSPLWEWSPLEPPLSRKEVQKRKKENNGEEWNYYFWNFRSKIMYIHPARPSLHPSLYRQNSGILKHVDRVHRFPWYCSSVCTIVSSHILTDVCERFKKNYICKVPSFSRPGGRTPSPPPFLHRSTIVWYTIYQPRHLPSFWRTASKCCTLSHKNFPSRLE